MEMFYTSIQWIFFFYLYSFLGWCYESSYVSLKQKRWVNRGFMRGPFLPLYGSGAIMMLVVSIPFKDNIILTFIAGCIGASILEYITGVTMESLFKVRYWDYTSRKFNFQGHICLAATLIWGIFTVLLTIFIHKPVEKMVLSMPYMAIKIITAGLTIFIVSDFTLSFKTALDLRDVLVKMDKIKQELARMQRRLDVILAIAGETKDNTIQYTSERADDIIESLENQFRKLKGMLPKLDLSDDKKEELTELRIKLGVHKERKFQLSHMKDFYRNEMIKGNPTMISIKFKEGLEEIKSAVNKTRQKK